MCPGSHFVLGKQSRFPYSSPGAPKALSQDDPVLQILATCAYTLGKAQALMDSAGLILSQEEAAVPCRLNGCCWEVGPKLNVFCSVMSSIFGFLGRSWGQKVTMLTARSLCLKGFSHHQIKQNPTILNSDTHGFWDPEVQETQFLQIDIPTFFDTCTRIYFIFACYNTPISICIYIYIYVHL